MSTWRAKSKAKIVNFHFIQKKQFNFIIYHTKNIFLLTRFPFMVESIETQCLRLE